jgi:N-acetylneuraminic acid mutarotase
MIVWGGDDGGVGLYNDGGRYNPTTDTWTAINPINATTPPARHYHTAVWTGTEMIVWGGAGPGLPNDGWRYDPSSNTWSPVMVTGAPAARVYHTAIWKGTELIVWGGNTGGLATNTGGRIFLLDLYQKQ